MLDIRKIELEKVAVYPSQYPAPNFPEVALAGRSNVGKSSFVNSISKSKVARTSKTPGKTRTINFYKMDDNFRVVDLPGYGYAKVSKDEKEKWADIINEYLTTRENLVDIIQVVDIRHKPTQQDIQMYNYIKSFGYRGIVLATKLDKIKRGQVSKNIKIIKEALGVEDDGLIVTYSSSKFTEKRNALVKLNRLLDI